MEGHSQFKRRSKAQKLPGLTEQKLKRIIKAYKNLRAASPDTWIDFAALQNSLEDAISVSSLCINHENKRHPHQYRLKQSVLISTKDELLRLRRKIHSAKIFDNLYQLIFSLDVYGLGDLTRYDIATRIGTYLKLFPDRVYLHAGTKAGAKKLLGKLDKKYLFKKDLPHPFRKQSLQYSEIEDILCIFKHKFENVDPILLIKKPMC